MYIDRKCRARLLVVYNTIYCYTWEYIIIVVPLLKNNCTIYLGQDTTRDFCPEALRPKHPLLPMFCYDSVTASMVGSCEIDTDEFDDIVDWSCTPNFPGVSIICLLNGVPLEDCICE